MTSFEATVSLGRTSMRPATDRWRLQHCSLPSGLYRRLRHLTGSADPSVLRRKALAGSGLSPNTAGGEFHPAL